MIGNNYGYVFIVDTETRQKTEIFCSTLSVPIFSSCWRNETTIYSGNRNGYIHVYDRRSKRTDANLAHDAGVCGLKWNLDRTLLASGSNDDTVKIWDPRDMKKPTRTIKRNAAIKALSWHPYDPKLLVSGGGTADRKIVMHHVDVDKEIWEIQTGSQISSVEWVDKSHVITTHGKNKRDASLHSGFMDCDVKIWNCDYGLLRTTGAKQTDRIMSGVITPNRDRFITAGCEDVLCILDLNVIMGKSHVFDKTECYPIR